MLNETSCINEMTDTSYSYDLEDSYFLCGWLMCWLMNIYLFDVWKFSNRSEERLTFKRFILNFRIGNLICIMIEPQGKLIFSIILADISTYTVTLMTNSEDCIFCFNFLIPMIGIILSILASNLANDLETTIELRILRGIFVMMCQIFSFGFVLISIKYYKVGFIMIMIGVMLFLLWIMMNQIVNEHLFKEFKFYFEDDIRKKMRRIQKSKYNFVCMYY